MAVIAVALGLGSAAGCSRTQHPTPTDAGKTTDPSAAETAESAAAAAHAADLARRPLDVVDARTRPEPHPIIPVGKVLTAYIGPRFLTGEEFVPEARVVLADDAGRVRALMREIPSPNPYPTVTLPGALAVAGLHDAHLHLTGIGQASEQVDLTDATSAKDVAARVRAFRKAHPSLTVIRGRGWDQSRFPGQAFPTAKDLAGIADDIPISLTRVDGHAVVVNAAILKKAGLDASTPDPEGGRLLRVSKTDTTPTGVLVDNAMDLVALPPPSDDDVRRWLMAGMAAAADAGLVAVHDMGLSPQAWKVLTKLDGEGGLPVRVFAYLDGNDDASYDLLGTWTNSDHLHLMGVKLYADGALGSRGAALMADYADESGHQGLLLMSKETMEGRIKEAHAKGFQVAVHAIGDRANHQVIESLITFHDPTIRDRLEHAQVLAVDDIPRLYAPRITASMQPTHATSDMRWAEDRLGAARLPGAYAWRSIWKEGVALAFGSDAPVERVRPALGIYASITRQDAKGQPPGGFLPEQRLSQSETLRAFARNAAWAVNLERQAGALTPGMYFDVSLFGTDAAKATDEGHPEAWLDVAVSGTVVGGTLRQPTPKG